MYLLFKALHLIAMVTWFAGLFYMFRLFVYWVENKENDKAAQILKTMSHKLYFYITFPSMVATVVFGLLLLSTVPGLLFATWMQIKLAFLTGLIAYHFYIGYALARFKRGDFYLTSKQCRFINEAPAVFLIVIVLLAVIKPF